jgi:hypothetical protein
MEFAVRTIFDTYLEVRTGNYQAEVHTSNLVEMIHGMNMALLERLEKLEGGDVEFYWLLETKVGTTPLWLKSKREGRWYNTLNLESAKKFKSQSEAEKYKKEHELDHFEVKEHSFNPDGWAG